MEKPAKTKTTAPKKKPAPTGTDPARSGTCALVGRPNVGKSTLLNALLGQKLAIVAAKPQTTRTSILGVYQQEDPATQIAFLDTPGLHRPKNALGRALVESAKAAFADADVIVMLTDNYGTAGEFPAPEDAEVLALVRAAKRPTILALNKVDRLKDKAKLLPILQNIGSKGIFDAIVPLSATRKVNFDGLIREIRERLPEGKIYKEDFFTDKPQRFFAAEFVREAVIRHTRQEIPHSVAVLVELFDESTRVTRIAASILVEKDSQKKIIIGAKGSMLKAIGTDARVQIEEMLEKQIFLELFVKVAEDWTDNAEVVRDATRGEKS